MKMIVFTVYDSKVERYLQPFFQQSLGQAMRSWADSVNDQNSQFHKHPEDYTLFELGTYEDESGTFENLRTPISRGIALEFKQTK